MGRYAKYLDQTYQTVVVLIVENYLLFLSEYCWYFVEQQLEIEMN